MIAPSSPAGSPGDNGRRLPVLGIGMGWFPEQAGGANRMYYGLSRHLAECGVDFRGCVAGGESVTRESGGRVLGFGAPSLPLRARLGAARRTVRAMLRESRPDVVAAHFALYAFPVVDLLGDTPLVVHFHGPWAAEQAVEGAGRLTVAASRFIERRVYRRARLAIVLSRAFAGVLERDYGFPGDRIRLVPGGVEVSDFDIELAPSQARAKLGWPADRKIVLVVRRLARRMGIEDLIDASARLKDRHPDLLFMVAGRGPEEERLRGLAAAAGVADHLRFLGFLPDEDLPAAYRAADLTVVPTVALEGFGLITIESLAAGTPVLVTPVGGLPEAVQDLSPDLVLSGTGAGAIGEGIDRLLTEPGLLPTAEACRVFCQERYDWSVITRRVCQVYEEAAER